MEWVTFSERLPEERKSVFIRGCCHTYMGCGYLYDSKLRMLPVNDTFNGDEYKDWKWLDESTERIEWHT